MKHVGWITWNSRKPEDRELELMRPGQHSAITPDDIKAGWREEPIYTLTESERSAILAVQK